MKNSILIVTLTLFFFSCMPNQKKFNQSKWNTADDVLYNHRESMIEDIKTNYLKNGMKVNDVKKLLGESELINEGDTLKLHYDIFTDFGFDIDPVETKTFIVNFKADSTLINTHIYHWKK